MLNPFKFRADMDPDTFGAPEEKAPEVALVCAVLWLALIEVTEVPRRIDRRRMTVSVGEKKRANDWIFSPARRPWSFIWCCSYAGLDHDLVRGRILDAPEVVWADLCPGAAKRRLSVTNR